MIGLEKYYNSEFGKKLVAVFPRTTCATVAPLFGAAGLPTFVNEWIYPTDLFGPKAGLPVRLTVDGDIADQKLLFRHKDLLAAKLDFVRERFMIDQHIEKLDRWLAQFSEFRCTHK